MNEIEIKPQQEEPNNGSGLGCLFAIILAISSVFVPFIIIWLFNLGGVTLKYNIITYLVVCSIIGFATALFILVDIKKSKVNENGNSSKSNQRQD